MLCAVDSPAKTLALPLGPNQKESKENEADYGKRCSEWYAKLEPVTCSWKIRQLLLFGDLEQSCEIWPAWGIMQDGVAFQQETPLGPTYEIDSGFSLPTPTKCDHSKVSNNRDFWKRRLESGRSGMDNLPEFATTIYPDGDGRIHPHLHEWLMDWPIGMTGLKPLEMARFRQWLDSHGIPSAKG